MKKFALIFMLWLVYDSYSQGWTMIWNDEFNGTAVDEEKWHNHPFFWSSFTESTFNHYTAGDNNTVQNGFLKIEARKEAVPYEYDGETVWSQHTSGQIYSRMRVMPDENQPVRVDVRFRIPKGTGLRPAIWLYSTYALYDEIDLFEAPNNQKMTAEQTIHWTCGQNKCNIGDGFTFPFDFSVNFHTVSAIWDMDKVSFFVDGKLTTIYDHFFGSSLNLVLGLTVNESDGPPANGWAPGQSLFEIDYVRVWKKQACASIIDKCEYYNGFDYRYESSTLIGNDIILGGDEPECSVDVSDLGLNTYWKGGEYLHTYAVNGSITLKPGFHAMETGDFKAKIKTCLDNNEVEHSSQLLNFQELERPIINEFGDNCIEIFKGQVLQVNKYFEIANPVSHPDVYYTWEMIPGNIVGAGTTFEVPDYVSDGTYQVICKMHLPQLTLESKATFFLEYCYQEPFTEESSILFFPNPASDQLSLQFPVAKSGMVKLRLRDVYGAIYLEKNLKMDAGKQELDIQVATLPKQLYVCEISTSTTQYSERIVIE